MTNKMCDNKGLNAETVCASGF